MRKSVEGAVATGENHCGRPDGPGRAVNVPRERRNIRVQVALSLDEWSAAQLVAALHGHYVLAVYARELLLRAIAKHSGSEELLASTRRRPAAGDERAETRGRGRPRAGDPRTMRFEVSLTPQEWCASRAVAGARSAYDLPAYFRELLAREMRQPEAVEMLGDDDVRDATARIERERRSRARRARREARKRTPGCPDKRDLDGSGRAARRAVPASGPA